MDFKTRNELEKLLVEFSGVNQLMLMLSDCALEGGSSSLPISSIKNRLIKPFFASGLDFFMAENMNLVFICLLLRKKQRLLNAERA